MTQSFVPFCLLAVFIVLSGQVLATSLFPEEDDYYVEETDREGRFFTSMKQDSCGTSEMGGICTSMKRCNKAKGSRIGKCGGFGTCCRIVLNCSSSTPMCRIAVNGTRIMVNASDHNMYKYYIQQPKGVSQVRLDFIGGLADADPSGECLQEYFEVRNSPTITGNNQRLRVCGNLTGQHMYLSFESDRIMAQLKKNGTKDIEVNVTFVQEGLGDEYYGDLVPQYCLQFYKDEGSMIKSFGYPVQQLNNQYYTICIDDRSVGFSGLEIQQCDDAEPFYISGMIPTGNATTDCPFDWIQIFGENRVCGSQLTKVPRPSAPYLISVNLNDQELYDIDAIIAQAGGKPGSCPELCFIEAVAADGQITCTLKDPLPAACGTMLEEDIMNTGFCLMLSSA